MSREELVFVGFSNSEGQCTSKILQDRLTTIERLHQKISFLPIVVKGIQFGAPNMDHLKSIITQRRNQALLSNFLNTTDQQDITQLYQCQEEARQRLHAIQEELQTAKVIAADLKVSKFMSETKANEATAYAYLREFNNNVENAVRKFKERDAIIRKFAEKNKMSYEAADNILKENGYNAQLFD